MSTELAGTYEDPKLLWMLEELEKVKYGQAGSTLVSTKYPKDLKGNLSYRSKVLAKAKVDPEYRSQVKALFFKDPVFAFNTFFFTLDTRKRPFHNQPFCTYAYQDILIQIIVYCIDNKLDLPILKSRDMGLSWILMLVAEWMWLNPDGGADFLFGSRIETYVDKKGDPRALFEKARYCLYKLPSWLRPKGFSKNKHDNSMRIINPEAGTALTGETSNPNFSTGGRYAAVFYDEFAKWLEDVPAWTAGGDATPCRIANSTPFGAAGQFYDLTTGDNPVASIHWTLHPEKSYGAYCFYPKEEDPVDELIGKVRSPWYDRECVRRQGKGMSAKEVAQELDMDFIGAGALVFDGSALTRTKALLKSKKRPIGYYSLDLQLMQLDKVLKPRDNEYHLCVFEDLDKSTCYTMGVDVVEGLEQGDNAVVKLMNRKTGDLAASYYGRIDEVLLARIVGIIAKTYAFEHKTRRMTRIISPWIGIETNGPGLATFDLCALAQVPNLFMMPKYDATTDTESVSKGWKTTTISRNVLVSTVRTWLQEGEGFVDKRAAKEFVTFVRSKSGKPEAKAGCNDDEVIAWGIALQIHEQVPMEEVIEDGALMESGLPAEMFGPYVPSDVPTLYERGLASIAAKKQNGGQKGIGFVI